VVDLDLFHTNFNAQFFYS